MYENNPKNKITSSIASKPSKLTLPSRDEAFNCDIALASQVVALYRNNHMEEKLVNTLSKNGISTVSVVVTPNFDNKIHQLPAEVANEIIKFLIETNPNEQLIITDMTIINILRKEACKKLITPLRYLGEDEKTLGDRLKKLEEARLQQFDSINSEEGIIYRENGLEELARQLKEKNINKVTIVLGSINNNGFEWRIAEHGWSFRDEKGNFYSSKEYQGPQDLRSNCLIFEHIGKILEEKGITTEIGFFKNSDSNKYFFSDLIVIPRSSETTLKDYSNDFFSKLKEESDRSIRERVLDIAKKLQKNVATLHDRHLHLYENIEETLGLDIISHGRSLELDDSVISLVSQENSELLFVQERLKKLGFTLRNKEFAKDIEEHPIDNAKNKKYLIAAIPIENDTKKLTKKDVTLFFNSIKNDDIFAKKLGTIFWLIAKDLSFIDDKEISKVLGQILPSDIQFSDCWAEEKLQQELANFLQNDKSHIKEEAIIKQEIFNLIDPIKVGLNYFREAIIINNENNEETAQKLSRACNFLEVIATYCDYFIVSTYEIDQKLFSASHFEKLYPFFEPFMTEVYDNIAIDNKTKENCAYLLNILEERLEIFNH